VFLIAFLDWYLLPVLKQEILFFGLITPGWGESLSPTPEPNPRIDRILKQACRSFKRVIMARGRHNHP
jgi:hypothetical protein